MKVGYLLIGLLLSLILVSAGEVVPIELKLDDPLTVDLEVSSGVEFNMFDGRHIVNLDKITKKGADLDVFLFVNRGQEQSVSYMTVTPKTTLKLDLDKDGIGDIYVGFSGFIDNGAKLIFYHPSDKEDKGLDDTTGAVTVDGIEDNPRGNGVFLVSGIIVILLFLGLFGGKIINKGRKAKIY